MGGGGGVGATTPLKDKRSLSWSADMRFSAAQRLSRKG